MRKVSQANLKNRRRSKWTVKVYHIRNGNANTISYLYQNTEKKKLFGQLRLDVREILSTLCQYKGVEIIEGAVCADHVHVCQYPTKDKCIKFYGIPEREEYANDI